jgi:predicted TIM-barrel fold metal-dependent hydrolase
MRPAPLAVIDPLYTLVRAPSAPIDAALTTALAELDRFGVERAGISLDDDPELARAALTSHPARFFARSEVDPQRGMDELRRLERLARDHGLRAVTASPARLFLPIDDRLFYPIFAKCIELGVAICPSLGVPAERVPFSPQKVERIDEVAGFFPELRIVMRDGCEPWQALAVLLMRRHPNLSYATGGRLPSEIPPELIDFANEDGAHQVLFASQPRAEAKLERFYKELPEIGLMRPVWPRFLRENVARILKLT